MNLSTVQQLCGAAIEAVSQVIVGKNDVLKKVLVNILSNGHVLMEDVPGLAKTLVARSFSQVLDVSFSRIQFTPDLLPSDITGASIYSQQEGTFSFSEGPVFSNLLLADEINRASPKTQSALLEAMQEQQVTVDGEAHRLSPPFLVFATQNPIELEGTYPLPEAQLDRFLSKISIGYPSKEEELEILLRRQERKQDDVALEQVLARDQLLEMQQAVEEVYVSREIGEYMVALVRHTRDDPRTQIGSSPRGTLALFKLSRAAAAIEGRDYVTPEDVKSITVMALSHRIILRPEVWVRQVRESDVVNDVLNTVPTPTPTPQT